MQEEIPNAPATLRVQSYTARTAGLAVSQSTPEPQSTPEQHPEHTPAAGLGAPGHCSIRCAVSRHDPMPSPLPPSSAPIIVTVD